MRGFRRINGANWLEKVQVIYWAENGITTCKSKGKLPLHWNSVRNILLVNNK